MLKPLALLLALTSLSPAADWPQFLGPTRNGLAAESEAALPDKPDAEPKTLWQKKIGSGFAGPTVADGKVVIFHRSGDEVLVEALDASDGTQRWKFSAPTDYRDSFGFDNGPRATPAVAGGLVFAHGADGMLYALDFKTGKLLWEFPTPSGIIAPPSTFTVDGKQYIAVVSGWGVDAQWIQGKMHGLAGWEKAVPEGGSVWVSALGD